MKQSHQNINDLLHYEAELKARYLKLNYYESSKKKKKNSS